MGTGQRWVELLSGLFSSPGLSNRCPQVLVSPTNPTNGWGPGIELDDPFTTDAGYQTESNVILHMGYIFLTGQRKLNTS